MIIAVVENKYHNRYEAQVPEKKNCIFKGDLKKRKLFLVFRLEKLKTNQ